MRINSLYDYENKFHMLKADTTYKILERNKLGNSDETINLEYDFVNKFNALTHCFFNELKILLK